MLPIYCYFGGLRMDPQFRGIQDNRSHSPRSWPQDHKTVLYKHLNDWTSHRRLHNTRCSELWYRHVETSLNTMRNNLHISLISQSSSISSWTLFGDTREIKSYSSRSPGAVLTCVYTLCIYGVCMHARARARVCVCVCIFVSYTVLD